MTATPQEFRDDEGLVGDGDAPVTRHERLLNRVVDGEATDAEWAEFREWADAEFPGAERCAWRELAMAQRQQAILAAAVGREVSAASAVDLPRADRRHGSTVAGRVGMWTGWAMAAAGALLVAANAWLGPLWRPQPGAGTAGGAPLSTAGLFRIDTPEDAIEVYKRTGEQTGRVIGEIPDRVLVESRPRREGPGFEVVYIRQFVERAEVTDLYRFGHSEAGAAPVLIPVSAPARHADTF